MQQKGNNNNNSKSSSQQPNKKPDAKKDLLRLQKPDIYNLPSAHEDEKNSIIKKLMAQKQQKPNFQLLGTSPLLQQVREFLPMLKKANEEAIQQGESAVIDKNIVKEQSSSDSESEQEESNKEKSTTAMDIQKNSTSEIEQEVSSLQEQGHVAGHGQHSLEGREVQLSIMIPKYPELEQQEDQSSSSSAQ